MSTEDFTHDVFLSHSAKDKAAVRPLAERLRRDGLKVWLDEWEIRPGDSIPAKIEEGLERSRVLVLCMSANAFGSDWAQLEAGTFRFRDPLNKERRFVPLRLDDAPIKGSLAQFLYINWLPRTREWEYTRLLGFLRNSAIPDRPRDSRTSSVGKPPFPIMKNAPPNAIQPLHIAEDRYLQILLSRFTLKRNRKGGKAGVELSFEFDDDTPAIWDQEGKSYLRSILSEDKRKRHQRVLDDYLIKGADKDVHEVNDPEFFFRYVSGGTLPVVHVAKAGGTRTYYCFFYRDINPIGWNIANGGSDTRAELLDPEKTIDRELREELIIADFDKKERYVFPGSKPFDHPAHAAARRLWKIKFPDLDLNTLKETAVKMDSEHGPDSVTVTMGDERQRTRTGFFLNINGLDFGIECDRIANIHLPESAQLFDGEIDAGRLVYCPVGLFDVRRFDDFTPNPNNYFPDFFFFGADRYEVGTSITKVLKDEFIEHVRPLRTEKQIEDLLLSIRDDEHCHLCPVTERIVRRHIEGKAKATQTGSHPPPRMHEQLQFDVFLSHSAKDKAVVRLLAERLRQDGLKLWFDEWVLKPGDNIPAKIEEGLERSRVLVLCMSANAFGSDWAQLEAGTFRFRDPLNQERRFIPLRLDNAPIKGSLAQFLYINWHRVDREQEYAKLLDACKKVVSPSQPVHTDLGRIIFAHKDSVYAIAIAPNGKWVIADTVRSRLEKIRFDPDRRTMIKKVVWSRQAENSPRVRNISVTADSTYAVTCSSSRAVELWSLYDMQRLREFHCPDRPACCVAISPDEKKVAAGSYDGSITVWDFDRGETVWSIKPHEFAVKACQFSTDGNLLISGSEDHTIGIWDTRTGRCQFHDSAHAQGVLSLVLSRDGRTLVSGSHDRTIRIWSIVGSKLRNFAVLEGHTARVFSLAITSGGTTLVSGSYDKTIRVWDMGSRMCIGVFHGHSKSIRSVGVTPDNRWIVSGSIDGTVRVWPMPPVQVRLAKRMPPYTYVPSVHVDMEGTGVTPHLTQVEREVLSPAQIQYTNAKMLLVGESGVGKTGLSNYLAHGIKVQDDKPLPSTDGAWATHWPLKPVQKKAGLEREIWLWDFAGQVDYRLVHQLFMDDAAAAVLVFNPQNENPFEGLGHWDRDLQKAARKPFAKLLAAARVDRGGLVVSAARIKKFMKERGFLGLLHLTSAKTGEGCDQLREAIVQAIDWKSIPETTSPALYHRLKQEILSLRDSSLVLIRLAELKQRMEMTLRGENFELAELEAVVGLLAGPGMIQRLDFGGFILLRPEVLSRYAAAVVRKVRKHPQELGCIREDELLAGDLDYQDFKRLPREDEAVVLRTLLETFISRAWCLRQPCDGSAMLTFPSYFRRERKEQPSHPSALVTYRFDGPADDIYATLVVRLHHTVAFQSKDLWKSAADYKTQLGAKLGFTLTPESEGSSRLEVYFEPDVDGNSRVLFLRYVHDHLMHHAQNVVRLRHYCCTNKKCKDFEKPYKPQENIDEALAPGCEGRVFCGKCGKPILLRDVIEAKFDSPAVKEQVREMQLEGQAVIDNESRELLAVHHTGFIVAEAGQIYRGYTNSDHGIDGEIEFKDDKGRASGKRLYLQLKSGDSYLKKRQRDGAEVFQIKNPRWADYWQQQAYAVMLVIRTSDGEISWMDVSASLKRESAGGKMVKQIVFQGEPLDVMSVRRWREEALGANASP